MVQNETRWLLDLVKSDWPGTWPDNLARIDRDEPRVLETGERTKSVPMETWMALGASKADRNMSPVGTEYDHRVETTVSIRLEGLHAEEWGVIDSPPHFEAIVRNAQAAINTERSYPTVEDVDVDGDGTTESVGSVAYHSLYVENEQDLSSDYGDHLRRDWDVRLVGYASLP